MGFRFGYQHVAGVIAWLPIAAFMAGTCVAAQPGGPSPYPITIEALQQRYVDEITAHEKYGAYAQRAVDEGYPNVAHLFRALAASEAVHARNFERLLTDLGVVVIPPEKPELPVSSTKKNIHDATAVEADEIDREYPTILENIAAEDHPDAIRNITYAWKAERQHRELIVSIRNASKRFFGILMRRIEGAPTPYYVCQVCGSTLTEFPPQLCPICSQPASHYQEVRGLPATDARASRIPPSPGQGSRRLVEVGQAARSG